MEKYRKFCAESSALVNELVRGKEHKAGKVVLDAKMFDALYRLVADTQASFNRDMQFNYNEADRRLVERFGIVRE